MPPPDDISVETYLGELADEWDRRATQHEQHGLDLELGAQNQRQLAERKRSDARRLREIVVNLPPGVDAETARVLVEAFKPWRRRAADD